MFVKWFLQTQHIMSHFSKCSNVLLLLLLHTPTYLHKLGGLGATFRIFQKNASVEKIFLYLEQFHFEILRGYLLLYCLESTKVVVFCTCGHLKLPPLKSCGTRYFGMNFSLAGEVMATIIKF